MNNLIEFIKKNFTDRIWRLSKEIKDLKEENKKLRAENDSLIETNRLLREKLVEMKKEMDNLTKGTILHPPLSPKQGFHL